MPKRATVAFIAGFIGRSTKSGAAARTAISTASVWRATSTRLGISSRRSVTHSAGARRGRSVRPARLWIYPAKSYSVTMPVKDAAMAHQVSLTDDEYKLGFSRLGDRLRIAGTAEFNGYDRHLNRVRCEAIVRRVEQLFPGAGDTS